MNSGVPWHVKGVGEQARDIAQDAARRAGMSVGEWLDSVITHASQDSPGAGDSPAGSSQAPRRYSAPGQHAAAADDLAEIARSAVPPVPTPDQRRYDDGPQRLAQLSQHLDMLRRHVEQLSRTQAAAAHAAPARAHDAKLGDVIAHSGGHADAFAGQDKGGAADTEIRRRAGDGDRAIGGVGSGRAQPSKPGPASPLDQAMVEIAERQRALDGETTPFRELPRAPTQELSALEAQLRQINSRIETLRPCGIDTAVERLRDDLAEIGLMIKEAMPRRAIEALENEVRSLAARIDGQRDAGTDSAALASLEHGLAEVRDALLALRPAESLMGLDEAMRALTQKIEGMAAGHSDPAALQQLESAIVGLRGVVSHVASNEALSNLSAEVRSLAAKVDQVSSDDILSTIGQRIETIADALQARHQQTGQEARDIEGAVDRLSGKIEQLHLSRTDHAALASLEDRIARLAEKLDASDALQARHQQTGQEARDLEGAVDRLSGKIEQLHLSRADHAALANLEDRIARLVEKLDASDARLINLEAIERGLAELLIYIEQYRAPSQAPGDEALKRDVRRTQDSLEAVHGTLGHVVDRLAMIETGMRSSAPEKAPQTIEPAIEEPPPPPQAPARTMITPAVPPIRTAAYDPADDDDTTPPAAAAPIPNPAPATERDHRPIDPDLPPDTPIEPGAARGRSNASAADRIAASEAALRLTKPPVIPDPGGKTNFIAAARRAAQTAAGEAAARPPKRAAAPGIADTAPSGRWNKRVRQLLVGTSVLVILLGSLHIAANLFSSADAPETEPSHAAAPQAPAASQSENIQAPASADAPDTAPAATAPATAPASVPSAPEKTAGDRQSMIFPGGTSIPFTTVPSGLLMPSAPAAHQAAAARAKANRLTEQPDPVATGTVRDSQAKPTLSTALTPPLPPRSPARAGSEDKTAGAELPTSIGSGGLRSAAAKGDPGAEYEIAVRYAEGHGVPKNLTAAAGWFERAAKQGLVMAEFRLGGHYEKGLGVAKDVEKARKLYTGAAEAGNAKAMHNLAVLYAEGAAGKPDYQTAARWFRKAADYAVADSQYNLGILYARGIGVETNLPEAYKWFALAARDGDKEAAKKRDDVGARLNQQALMAGRAAVQVWTAQTQPAAAIDVKAPAGGWDSVPAPSVAKRRVGPKAAATPAGPAQ
jgi:localization factor PodJL